MDISFRQLQAFVLIAEHRSFSRAAEQVHLSQPALSYSLRKLEDALGLSLLARNTRSVELTAAGLRFLEQARRLLRDMDNAVHDAHEQLHLESGSLRIAVLPSVAIEPLPRVLQEYRRRYPGIDISLHDGRAGEIRQWVTAAEVDFAITSAVDDLGALDFQPLYDDSLVLLVRGHERLRGKALLAALREQDYIATTRDTSLRSMADETLQRMGLLREPAWEVAYMSSAAALARAGLGFALLPASGPGAAHTGAACVDWCGHLVLDNLSVAGNMLAGPRVIEATAEAYQATAGLPMAERLLAAMDAGEAAGGDKRGKQAAALRIHTDEDYLALDLRVDDHAEPLVELRRLYEKSLERFLPFTQCLPGRGRPSGTTDRALIEAHIEKFHAERLRAAEQAAP